MHTIKQIIENQDKFKDQILDFFISEFKSTSKQLNSIESSDEFILKEKDKLLKKFKKFNTIKSVNKYFYKNNNRDENYYVWWDTNLQEALILSYGKK